MQIDTMINIALACSKESKDPEAQIGAVTLDAAGYVLGTGVNGYPKDYNDNDYFRKGDKVIHAEVNAVINSRCKKGDIHTVALYGLPPCNECMKFLSAYGVKRIVYSANPEIKSLKKWQAHHDSHKCLHTNMEIINYDN